MQVEGITIKQSRLHQKQKGMRCRAQCFCSQMTTLTLRTAIHSSYTCIPGVTRWSQMPHTDFINWTLGRQSQTLFNLCYCYSEFLQICQVSLFFIFYFITNLPQIFEVHKRGKNHWSLGLFVWSIFKWKSSCFSMKR